MKKSMSLATAFMLALLPSAGQLQAQAAKRMRSLNRDSYKGNKVTVPNSKGVYASNVQDGDGWKVIAAEDKRETKKAKRYGNAIACAYHNACVSLAYADKYQVEGLLKAI